MSLLFTICALHFVAQLSPGPDVLLIAKSAASNTRRNTLLADYCGYFIWDCNMGGTDPIGFYGFGAAVSLDSASLNADWRFISCQNGMGHVVGRLA